MKASQKVAEEFIKQTKYSNKQNYFFRKQLMKINKTDKID